MSFISLIAFYNMTGYILLASKLSSPSYSIIIVMNVLVITPIIIFLDFAGYKDKIWKFWQSLPILGHKILCVICLFWIFFSLKALLPAIKKDYEKNYY